MTHLSPEFLGTLVIQIISVCFSAGFLVATVLYLRREVKEHGHKIEEHDKDIQGLKVHTHYHG